MPPSLKTQTDRLLQDHHDDERRPMHVVICARAYKALQDFADNNGATVTGLVDALAHALEAAPPVDADRTLAIAAVARAVDVERRRKRYEASA